MFDDQRLVRVNSTLEMLGGNKLSTTQIVTLESTEITILAEQLEQLTNQTREFIESSKTNNTMKAYASDWSQFEMFCNHFEFISMPAAPRVVARYAAFMAVQKRKVATIQRHLASISMKHKAENYESPTNSVDVQSALQGIRKKLGEPQVQKDPLLIEDVRRIMCLLPNDIRGKRDRALLLIGFAGAFRRSELVSIQFQHVEVTRSGLVILLPRSKTDQEGHGRKVAIPYGSNIDTCPVRAFQDWVEATKLNSGFLFRPINKSGRVQNNGITGKTVARLVKSYVGRVGLDPNRFAGHSLRAGLATSAAAAGASMMSIQKQTGHRSNVVNRYIREGDLFKENAAAKVGL
jgi:site-specific recombinase XerD